MTVNGAALTVTPASSLTSTGPVGGPFSPISQTYTLSNSGGATLSWTASNAANWLSLSASSGTLAVGGSTTVIASINANANSLTAGSYPDTLSFTNVTNGVGNTTRGVSLTVTSTNASNFGFYDDFSTFSSGNLVGQHTWTQVGTISAAPIQITGGKVVIPSGLTASSQTAYKNFTLTNEIVFYGTTLTVSNASNSGSVSYFTALYTSNNATGFANYRLSARSGDTANTNYLLGVRVTGQATDPYTFGAGLTYGTQYRVIVETSTSGSNMTVYVNPTSSNLGAQTPYLAHTMGAGASAPTSVGSAVISEFGTTTIPSDGETFGKAVVADSFVTVYNDLLGVLPGQLVISPASRDFGAVTINQTNSLPFFAINAGGSSLTGTATVAGPFAIAAGASFTVGAGQTQTVTVSFQPGGAGAFTNAVVFTSAVGSSTNAVTGVGVTAGQISVSPASFDFGTVVTGNPTQTTFVVTNTGGTTVSNGTSAVSGGPFSVISGGTFALAGGASTNVVVQFAPVAEGGFTNSLIVATANGGSSTNTVMGTGVVAPAASFTGNPTSGQEPLVVNFTDTSTGTINSRFWDFGDSNTTNTTTNGVSHVYVAGTYTVTLVVTGPGGVSTNSRPGYITALTAFQSWQAQHFGSTTNSAAAANADPDGDGQNNQAEFLAGTDPLNSSDFLRITSAFNIPSGDVITWTAVSNKGYQAEISLDLTSGIWSNVGLTVTNDLGLATLSETNGIDPSIASRFYRILLAP